MGQETGHRVAADWEILRALSAPDYNHLRNSATADHHLGRHDSVQPPRGYVVSPHDSAPVYDLFKFRRFRLNVIGFLRLPLGINESTLRDIIKGSSANLLAHYMARAERVAAKAFAPVVGAGAAKTFKLKVDADAMRTFAAAVDAGAARSFAATVDAGAGNIFAPAVDIGTRHLSRVQPELRAHG